MMSNTILYATLGLVAALGAGLSAQPASAQGFEIGGRVGFGVPFGDVADEPGSDKPELSEGIMGQIPVVLDLGYRATPQLFVGGYFSYGFGIMGDAKRDACPVEEDCSVWTLSYGVQAQYHLAPGSGADFWFGAGVGYEELVSTEDRELPDDFGSFGDIESSATFSGVPVVLFQMGIDLDSDPKIGSGPFVSVALGSYTDVSLEASTDGESSSDSFEIEDTAMHGWLTLGFRGTFVL